MLQKLLVAYGLVFIVAIANAQTPEYAIPKALRDGYSGHSGATRQTHAQNHATILYQISAGAANVPGEIVQEETLAIRSHTEAATKSFASLKETAADNKLVQQQLASLQNHHDKVIGICTKLEQAATKGAVPSPFLKQNCMMIARELYSAGRETQKLHETLKIVPLTDSLKELTAAASEADKLQKAPAERK